MIGIVFALLSAIFIGFSQISLRKSYRELLPSVAFLFDAIFGLFIWVGLSVFMGISSDSNLWIALVYGVISAILSEAIVFFALSHGELSVTATVLATYPVYTVLFSRLLNNEILSTRVLLFVILAIVGSILASAPEKIKKLKLKASIVYPFVAAICIGLSDTLSKGYINASGDYSFLFMLGLVQIPVALTYLRIEKQSAFDSISGLIKRFNEYKFALLGGLFNIVGTGFLWLSFSFAPASIASPITGCNGVLTVILSRLFFKEKISTLKHIGIAMAITGVIGITLSRNN